MRVIKTAINNTANKKTTAIAARIVSIELLPLLGVGVGLVVPVSLIPTEAVSILAVLVSALLVVMIVLLVVAACLLLLVGFVA